MILGLHPKTYAANGMSSRQYRNRQSGTSAEKSGQSLFAFLICHIVLSRVRERPVLGRRVAPHRPRGASAQEHQMLDLIMLAIGLGFFALSVGYTIACDRL